MQGFIWWAGVIGTAWGLAAVLSTLLKGLCCRVAFRFGWRPNTPLLDRKLRNEVIEGGGLNAVMTWQEMLKEKGRSPEERESAEMYGFLASYAAWVIDSYIWNFNPRRGKEPQQAPPEEIQFTPCNI